MPITGYPAINDSDLIRDGFIETFLTQLHTNPRDIARLLTRNLPAGTTLILTKDDDGNVTEIRERRKLLPASKIQLQIQFSKILKGTGESPVSPGFAPIPSFGLFSPGFGIRRAGGLTNIGTTEITYQINDTKTIINRKVTVTQEMLDTEEIEFNDYPLSFFGIVREHIEEEDIIDEETGDVTGTKVTKYGLDFTQEQLDKIGRFTSGQFEGAPRRSIMGATSDDGHFGGRGAEEVDIEDILFDDQENLFLELVRDIRKFKFRGDNPDASGERAWPYDTRRKRDATANKIKIKTEGIKTGVDPDTNLPVSGDLKVGETLYLTYNTCTKRRIRQCFRHRGQGFQDNSIGVAGEIGIILTTSDVFDFQLTSWYVPKIIPAHASGFPNFDAPDSEFKTPIDLYIHGNSADTPDARPAFESNNELIEGWRWSEVISEKVEEYWSADYRGIIYVKDNKGEVVFPRASIRDQAWFETYLDDIQAFFELRFSSFDARTDTLEEKFKFDRDRPNGWLIDISEPTNTLLFDREKIPYSRLFANALERMSPYVHTVEDSGVGVVALDLLRWLKQKENIDTWERTIFLFPGSQFVKQTEFPIAKQLTLMDLSLLFFNSFSAVPLPNPVFSCEEDFMFTPNHFPVDTVDAIDGRGIFLTQSFIDNQFQEWRPPGGFLNSQWLLTTPYYCGEFSRKTRVFIEGVGGNSLENFSTIYVNTVPSSPSNISLDNTFYTDQATVSFRDDLYHDSIVYNRFYDAFVSDGIPLLEQDTSITHEPVEFSHEGNRIIGVNRILGDRPSFSNGIPITTEARDIFKGNKPDFLLQADLLDASTDGFLDVLQDTPILTLPDEWRVKSIILEYDILEDITNEEDKSLSLKFTGSETIVNDINFPIYGRNNIVFTIDAKFYAGGPIEMVSSFWDFLTMVSAKIIYTTDDLIDYKLDSGQTATVYDKGGRLLIFYADDVSGNLSVAATVNRGDTWDKFTDILRLTGDETASLPFIISSIDTFIVHLFWVLNDSFIMHTEIDTRLLVNEDIGVEYVPPSSYDATSDDDNDDNTNSSLASYSDSGKELRRKTSYFVAGNATDPLFEETMAATQEIKLKNNDNEDTNSQTGGVNFQSVRYDFLGDAAQLNQTFLGNAYTVYIDNGGVVRLFMLVDNKLTLKVSGDFLRWFNHVENIVIHKNFVGVQGELEDNLEVTNIQIGRNPFDNNDMSMFYFHDGMLFMRGLQSNLLAVGRDLNENMDNSALVEHLTITENSGNKPIFLVGSLSQNIKDSLSDPELAIKFYYNNTMINNFDDRFGIDTSTQVVAYIMSQGLMRVFYKDNIGSLQSLLISGLRPSLEVQNKPKNLVLQAAT
tara:strand:+ start:13391 stop:17419 length:4029 start_codon:yes stop_codon:yes gene_type:complete